MKKPLVTIGIPTYNRAGRTLSATIESALQQTYENIEVIISDNCSIDHTGEVVNSYGSGKIRYMRQEVNIGSNGNYNALLKSARGDYFLLLHDDDLIDPDFIQTCMDAARYETSYGLIRTGTRMIDDEGNFIKESRNILEDNSASSLYAAWLNGDAAFYLCSTLFNTTALRRAGGLKSKNNLFEDGIAIITISQTWPILSLETANASFRMHAEQRTHAAYVGNWCEDFKQAIDLICHYEKDKRTELYKAGMLNFSKVALYFTRKIDNPLKRFIAMFRVNKYFPYKYWPKQSWKASLIGLCASIFYPERRPI
jgi:glycosyltransferase involved in cell wall biosynthesis